MPIQDEVNVPHLDQFYGWQCLASLSRPGDAQPTALGVILERDALVNLLWPEYDQARGRTNLRRTLYALRKALAGDWLDVDREAVRLNPCAEVWLDVDQFHRHLAECLTHGHLASEVCSACLPHLTAAVALYRGDFLSGFSLKDSFNFDDWQFFQADALRREVANALARLVQGHIAQGAFEHALNYAMQWLALDRLNEAAHYQLMQLYAWSGQRSAALRQYQECAKILENELGVSPQESTTVLHQAIQEGRAPKPPVALNLPRLAERELDRPAVQATIDVAKASTPPLGAREGEPVEARRGVFVARERELAQLGGYLDAALAGRGRVVFVIGGPGRGKTALIQEFALHCTARLHKLCREVGTVQERVEALLRIATERGFGLYQAWGTILRGWVLAEGGEIVEGIAKMQQGLAALRDMGLELLLPEFFSFLADAYGKAGQIEEGLRLVAEALMMVERTGERKFEAELHRLKGELLLSQVEAKAETEMGMRYQDAEKCFQRALEVARRQSAKSWELRAAMSLSCLWQRQGKKEKARKLLQEIYGWFTEGFDTADLMEAKALLDALA